MADAPAFTTAELADCAERETRMRTKAYPRFVDAKRMTQTKADRELAMMTAIAKRLRTEADGERLL